MNHNHDDTKHKGHNHAAGVYDKELRILKE